MRLNSVFVVVALLAGGAVPASTAARDDSAPGAAADECTVSDTSAERIKKPQNRAAERAKIGAGRALEKRFGNYSATNRTGQLERGYIGTVVDEDSRIVVVVDPRRVDPKTVAAEANAAVKAARETPQAEVAPLEVRTQAGCFSAAELLEALQVLTERSYHPRAKETGVLYYLDAHDSRFKVTFNAEDGDVAKALEERLGDRVRVHTGELDSAFGAGAPAPAGSRYNDKSRDIAGGTQEGHYGGAGIGDQGDNGVSDPYPAMPSSSPYSSYCTTSFSVTYNPGHYTGRSGRAVLTAGHCYNDAGSGLPNSGQQFSGVERMGTPLGEAGSGTELLHDGILVDDVDGVAPEERWDNKIYTNSRLNLASNPNAATVPGYFRPLESRAVVSTYTIPLLASPRVCFSGRISGNVCDAAVLAAPATFCFDDNPAEGCVFNARIATQSSGFQIVTDGDSGGPVYVCVTDASDTEPNTNNSFGCNSASDRVAATGTIVARGVENVTPGFGIFQPMPDLEAFMDVTTATTASP